MNRCLNIGLAILMALAITACGGKGGKKAEKPIRITTVACDDSFENIMCQEIDVFEYLYRDMSIIPYYVNESAALDSLFSLKTRTIVVPRQLTAKEVSYLKGKRRNVKQSKIAVDAIALIVNKENPTEILSMGEIAQILSGELTRWDEIEPNKLGRIDVVFDHQGSSTVKYMRDSLLNGKAFGANVFAQKSNAEVFNAVKERKNAIGIIGVSWISSDMRAPDMSREDRIEALERNDTTQMDFDSGIKVLKVRRDDDIRAYKPYQAYIYDGSYPLFRSIYMITTAANGSAGHSFYSFVTGFRGQKIIQMTGILPATIQPRMVSLE
ncbi:MAG: substrate-binding domain-containing protein [Muribaculaceae bacterium]|nr:substrate-binding domain-containing protein [Muribaculaceae bacterium]